MTMGTTMLAIGSLGWQEIVIIGAIFLLLFGARRLPEIGQSLGKGIREFKNSLTSPDDEPQLGSGDKTSEGQQVKTPHNQEEPR